MTRLPRRLALWGGAAAIAGGGFAFMASNNVLTSSAGDGAGHVTGYTVTNQAYTIANRLAIAGTTGSATAYLSGVTFTLAANSATANAHKQPPNTNILVYPENKTGGRPWGHGGYCSVNTWTTSAGTGNVTCTFSPQPPVATVFKLDVEASQ